MAHLGLFEAPLLFVAAFLVLLLGFRVPLWQLDAELPRQVERGLDGPAEAARCGPYVHHVAAEAAGEAVGVVVVEVHRRVGVLVVRRHAAGLAGAVRGDDPVEGYPFLEQLEDAHARTSSPSSASHAKAASTSISDSPRRRASSGPSEDTASG